MKAQYLEIYDHDSDVDISHKANTTELDNWICHINYIEKELVNLSGIYKVITPKLEDDSILNKLFKKQAENETLLNALNKYVLVRSNLIECDDMQCDMVYITEHESYRRSYLYHIDKYRRLKSELYSIMYDRLTL
ncbi:hypothetical protein [Algibacter sp. L4_22]|uniref:hypothetical protein n=1 Tax=Algibacter sp. L4_22 TaxID=2942477 RepID=UPI00201B5DCD|nr:hypothetical protein [Algibacter sp. L4_22]MCL5128420.1 hypothetical protein [Algibacter sp. L4_22]